MRVLVEKGELTFLGILQKITHPEVAKLPVGDLVIINDSGSIIVERKTVRDLIGSIRTNRLWSQLVAMVKTQEIFGCEVKRRLLVIEGGFWQYATAKSPNERHFWSSMMGTLMSVNFVYGIPCIVCENNFAFETFLRILLQREENGSNDSPPKSRWSRKSTSRLPIKDVKTYFLDSIPSIGQTRAKLLLDHYGTIENIARSSKSDLMKVHGIGKQQAEKIYEVFH